MHPTAVTPALIYIHKCGRAGDHGAEPLGEVAQYEDKYRLCYIRGPEGIIVALAEQLG